MYIQTDRQSLSQASTHVCTKEGWRGQSWKTVSSRQIQSRIWLRRGTNTDSQSRQSSFFCPDDKTKKVSIFFFDRFRIGKNESDFSNNFKRETELNEYFCMNNKSLMKKMVLQREKNKIFPTADRVIIQLLGNLTGGHLIEFHLIKSVDRIFRSNA